ncbi:hypothetical protein AKJ16_DCAP14339 [Drosera capensis]
MASLVSAGDVVLLQNVKITTFANVIEAKTVHCSAVLTLVHINKKRQRSLVGKLSSREDSKGQAREGDRMDAKVRNRNTCWTKRPSSMLSL